MSDYEDDYRYSEEARGRNLQLVYTCNMCGRELVKWPEEVAPEKCYCGGEYLYTGDCYDA